MISTPLAYAACVALSAWCAHRFLYKFDFRRKSDVHRLKYPKPGHWLWGHEKEVLYDQNYSDVYSEWMGKMGAVLRTKAAFWHSDILVVADPLALWHIDVKNPNNYVKSNLSRALVRRLMGESLVWAEGTEHKKLRAAFAPCFSFLKVREMEPVVLKAADMLVGSMKNYIIAMQSKTSNKSLRSNPPIIMNLSGWTNKATLDVIGRVGFDFDFGLGESPEARELSRIWEEQARESATFAGFVGFLAMRAFPFLASLPIKAMEKQSAYKLYVRSIGSKIAGSKIARIQGEDDSKDDSDIISAFIRYSRKEGSEVSVDKLLDHFTTFIQAGNDTTATSVNYALLTLAQHPEVQTHLRNELEDFGREPTFDDLHNKDVLKFLDAVTKESLRMFPVGAHSERVALKDDILPLSEPISTSDGGLLTSIRIQKGQVVAIPRVSINTRPSAWGPDGEVFRPSRWLDADVNEVEKGPTLPQVSVDGWNNFDAFGEGSRFCIGYRLAIFEMKAIMAALVRAFKFEEVQGIKIKKRNLLTLQPLVVENSGESKNIRMDGPWFPVKVSLADPAA